MTPNRERITANKHQDVVERASLRASSRHHVSLPLCLAVTLMAVAALAVVLGASVDSTQPGDQRQTQDRGVSDEATMISAEVAAAEEPPAAAGGDADAGACCRGGADPDNCPADLDGSGEVGVDDLFILLAAWGECAKPENCPADLNGSGEVGVDDLFELLAAWGPCPENGECDIVTLEMCEDLDGYFLGTDTSCEDCPAPVVCSDEAVEENEPCGESTNDGCSLDPPAFGQALTCGDDVCGTLWAIDGQRDEDWFTITVTEDTKITWTVEAPYPVEVIILTETCPALVAASSTGINPTVQACVAPGEYILAIRPDVQEGLACDSGVAGYTGTVSCESCTVPTGACCTPDGGCDELSSLQCFVTDDDAVYMGDGSQCSQVDCPFGPPLGLCEDNCGEVIIDDGLGGFCDCDVFCEENDTCCPGVCADCPDLPQCDPAFICFNAEGDCCEPNNTPGCEDASCCDAVCSCDPYCCAQPWDAFCSLEGPCSAAELCPACGGEGCPPVSCQNNENEPCGEALNDGCLVDQENPPFGTIQCGETICGNLWAAASPDAPNGARDEDWFLLDLTEATSLVEITWSVEASHPVSLHILTPTCPTQVLAGPINDCAGSLTITLEPGEYVMFVAPTVVDGLPCPGFAYEATLTCKDAVSECKGNCGGIAPSGCFCDESCFLSNDCCPGICDECPDFPHCDLP